MLLTAKMACMQSDAMLPYVNGMLHLVTSIPSLTSGDKYPMIDRRSRCAKSLSATEESSQCCHSGSKANDDTHTEAEHEAEGCTSTVCTCACVQHQLTLPCSHLDVQTIPTGVSCLAAASPASSLSCRRSVSARAMIASPSRSPAPFCGQPLMRLDPSMGTNLNTTWPDLNASPYVPSPILTTWVRVELE